MCDIEEVLSNISANEEIAKKFFEIEACILTIGNFKDLFEKLLLLIEEKFSIPHVWISIVRENAVSYLIEALESSPMLKERLNIIKKGVFFELINNRAPVLVNEELKPFYRFLPKNQKYFAKSLAVVPLVLDGVVIGSLNLGDFSESRFQPDLDTFFLSHLAVKISICLSNVTAREELTYLATRDPLTGLLNRREMEKMLAQEFSRATRYGTPLAVLLIDCDDFKLVNDTYGHNCGDIALHYLAEQIIGIIRNDDMVFRSAGDEFFVILPNQTSKEASKVSERLQAFFKAHPVKFEGSPIPISISCGIASTRDPEIKSPVALLKEADEQLYKTKKGKDLRSVQ